MMTSPQPELPAKTPIATDRDMPTLGTTTPEPSATAKEQPLWTGRTHWKHHMTRIVLWSLGNIAACIVTARIAARLQWTNTGDVVWVCGAILILSGLFVLAPVFWTIISRRYRLTNQRLIIERGIFSQTIDQTELIRVDDVRIYKSITDRLFGLGTIAIISTDATDRVVTIAGIPSPDQLADQIRSNMRRLRQKSLYVEQL
ncbi:MAG: PH domain-containing protein [Planctomycetota bacterium]